MLNLSGSLTGPPFALPSGFLPCGEVRLVPGWGERNCQKPCGMTGAPDAPSVRTYTRGWQRHSGRPTVGYRAAIAEQTRRPTSPSCAADAGLHRRAGENRIAYAYTQQSSASWGIPRVRVRKQGPDVEEGDGGLAGRVFALACGDASNGIVATEPEGEDRTVFDHGGAGSSSGYGPAFLCAWELAVPTSTSTIRDEVGVELTDDAAAPPRPRRGARASSRSRR